METVDKRTQNEVRKVKRDGKVAVLYSPGFGAGWYSWNTDDPQCLFSPEIVELVEQNRKNEITDELCMKLFGVDYFYSGGGDDLKIRWLPEGTAFIISEYDGSESIDCNEETAWIIA